MCVCVCLTDAFEVVKVLFWFVVRFQLLLLVADVHPSILHDLLRNTQTAEIKGTVHTTILANKTQISVTS